MKNTIKLLAAPFVALTTAFALTSCDVDKTADGEMPEVDVDVETKPGKLPEYDVEGPDVKTGTKKIEVEVPTIDVDLPEEEEDATDKNDGE
ncbi:hypothetical protein V2O64_05990 [Verrucomicrobiaceae bacterium 227]